MVKARGETPFYQKRLRAELVERISKNPRYSLRAFAKALKLEPSALSQILNGKRSISDKLADRILKNLTLTALESERFYESLAEVKQSQGLKRISPKLKSILTNRNKNEAVLATKPSREISFEAFRIVGEWYHYAILELTRTKSFRSEAKWIAQQLGITTLESQSAIDRLLDLELLEWKEDRLQKTEIHLETADKKTTSPALRLRQKQILEKSIYSLEHDPIEERNHSGITFAADISKIPGAKKKIQDFLAELSTYLEMDNPTRVYELTVNLIPLQKNLEAK